MKAQDDIRHMMVHVGFDLSGIDKSRANALMGHSHDYDIQNSFRAIENKIMETINIQKNSKIHDLTLL